MKAFQVSRCALAASALSAVAVLSYVDSATAQFPCSGMSAAFDVDGTTALGVGVGIALTSGVNGLNANNDWRDCETAPGFYLGVAAADNSNTGDALKIYKAPAGWYAMGAEDVVSGQAEPTAPGSLTTMNGAAKIFPCPTNSNSAAGSDSVDDCTVNPGYYLSSAGMGSAGAGTITQVPAGKYFAGGTSVGQMSVDVPSSCPANSDSPAGSDALADCTCNTGYTLSGSTCVANTGTTSTTSTTSSAVTAMSIGFAVAVMAMPVLI